MPTPATVSSTAEAWRKYVSVGAIASDLLRPHVLRAWVRSHEQGASAWVARAEMLSHAGTERMLERHAHLLAAARPYLHLLSQAAGNEPHAAMLGTGEAIVLDVVGDEQSICGPERVPGPGSLLSEAMCGSNGIGTALAEGRYVEIISAEHFIHGFHPFTCSGIPIETPEGERQGVLSVSVRRPGTAERLHEILVCAAHGIAAELLRCRLADQVHDVMSAGEGASLDALRAELVRLGALPATGQPGPVLAARTFQMTLELLRLAGNAARELDRRERAWRELSSDDLGIPSQIELTDEVSDLVALLAPETRRRHVEVGHGRTPESITGFADRRKLRRELFRLLLRAIDVAEGGGAIVIDIGEDRSAGLCYTRVEATPAPACPGERTVSAVVCPRVPPVAG
jgi:transcriptional regulator of acetoin/glycerol metabolism